MEESVTSVLIVAHRTAAAPSLIEAVRTRAAEGPCRFTLLVPSSPHGLHRVVDPEDHGHDEAEAVIELALPHLEEAAGEDALNRAHYDEVIVSTLPSRVSRWLHLDLPRKVAGLGVPVTTVSAQG